MITSDANTRKETPIFSGVLRYFPDALAAVARMSKAGNDKHNPGEPLHWAREKSTDHGDCIVRHQIEFDQIEPDSGEYHAVAVAWRALAQLQLLEEQRDNLKEQRNGIRSMCEETSEVYDYKPIWTTVHGGEFVWRSSNYMP